MPAHLKHHLLGLGDGAGGILGRDGTFITVEAPRPDLDPEDLFSAILITTSLHPLYNIGKIVSSLTSKP